MGVIVRQKTKGRGQPWWVFVSHNGKRTSRKIGDRQATEKVASEIRAKLQLGKFGFEEKKPVPTFKEYADSWIKTNVPATCKQSTLRDYQDILRIHVLPVFGNLRLTDINKGMVKDFLLGKVNAGLAASTVIHLKNVISGVLNKAVDNEILPANPAHSLGKIVKAKDRKETMDPLTAGELRTLLDSVRDNYKGHYPLFMLLARTGMRIGEALALQWGDIDFTGRFISVNKSLVRGRISTPKSGKSRRVDMSLQLMDTLKHHQLDCKKKGLVLGLGDIPEHVFTDSKGGPIEKNNWRRRVFNKALDKAGLRKIRIHDIRHGYATMRISQGHNIADVSKQLGHHSIKLTLDTYFHWIPGGSKSEVDALDDAFEGVNKVVDKG